MIKDRLPEAVQQCIHAAAGEHEPAVQRGLLRVRCSVVMFRGNVRMAYDTKSLIMAG